MYASISILYWPSTVQFCTETVPRISSLWIYFQIFLKKLAPPVEYMLGTRTDWVQLSMEMFEENHNEDFGRRAKFQES